MKRATTLVELMIVVGVIGLLAAVAIPRYAVMVKKSKEGATKGALAALRAALMVYYADNEGNFIRVDETATNGTIIIDTFTAYLVPKYITAILPTKLPDTTCAETNTVYHFNNPAANANSNGGWGYDGIADDETWGDIRVNCKERDLKGIPWTSY